MSLLDDIATEEASRIQVKRPAAPTGFEPGVRYDPTSGRPTEFTTAPVAQDVQHTPGAWDDLVTSLGMTLPAGYEARLLEARFDPHAWTRDVPFTPSPAGEGAIKTPATTKPAWRYRFAIVARSGVPLDLDGLVKQVRGVRRRKPKATIDRTRVVVVSDLQVGKVASGGGTAELLARVSDKLDHLEATIDVERCEDLVIVDPGDLIENAFNVQAQAHTNDLSLPDQLRVARAALTEIVTRLSRHHVRTRVCTVASNHGQWRVSMGQSGQAGRPGDDFGIDVHRAVAEAFRLAGREDVTFIVPDPWQESLALQVRGAVLGVVHGHQAKTGDVGKWWAGQSHGDGPTAAAHILVHGHWHNASIRQSGALGGRPRWIVSADAMDGGSDWWRNLTGEQAETSVVTFTVGEDGRWDNYRRIVGSD